MATDKSDNAHSSPDHVTRAQFDELVAQLRDLRSVATEAAELKAENQLLRQHLQDSAEPRRQTQDEAFKEAHRIIDRSRQNPLPEAKFEWEIRIAPYLKRDHRGKQEVYSTPIRFRSTSKNSTIALEQFRKYADTNLEPRNCQMFAVGFQPEGDAIRREESEAEELIPA